MIWIRQGWSLALNVYFFFLFSFFLFLQVFMLHVFAYFSVLLFLKMCYLIKLMGYDKKLGRLKC